MKAFIQGDPKKVRIELALGGLFHDLGKLIVRKTHGEEAKRTFPQLGKETSYKENYKYLHAYFTHAFLKKLFEDELHQYPILEASACHHLPEKAKEEQKIFARIYQLADQYSSAERSTHIKISDIPLLRPIFQIIDIPVPKECLNNKQTNNSQIDKYYYKLRPLKLDKDTIFPINSEETNKKFSKDEISFEYQRHFKTFEEELKKGYNNFLNYRDLEYFLYITYYLCYKYLWCVPASTYDPDREEGHYPDISLFDHMRVTAAFAASLWTDYNLSFLNKNLTKPEKNLKLLFIKGDISGIQNFLYSITNLKGIAKRLRGRSLFLTLLSDLVALSLVNKFGYPFVNILFSGGGHFEIVLGYEEGIEEDIENFRREVEELLLKEFKGTLGLVLSAFPITLLELKNKGYREINKQHFLQLDKQKKRKFASLFKNIASYEEILALINADYRPEKEKRFEICNSCTVNIIEEKAPLSEEERICSWCNRFKDIGENVPRAELLLYSKKELPDFAGFYLENLGGYYFLKREELHALSKFLKTKEEAPLIFLLNDTDFFKEEFKGVVRGFKFVGQSVPVKENEGRSEVKPFEELVLDAEGDKKLAFARADVDNLGLIFREGLGEDYSISRIATLSRSLDLFFSGYLNKLFEKNEYKNKIYTLYAGGDDLFIVGPWDVTLDAVNEIRKEFKEYTCNNCCIDLSCGVFIGSHSYPIRFAGEKAGILESKAKKDKPAICALEEVLKWDDYEKAIKESNEFCKYFNGAKKVEEKKSIGRSLLYKFYLLLRHYMEPTKNSITYRFYPMFYYYLYRNIKDENDRKRVEEFILDIKNDYQIKKRAKFNLKYVIMKTRKMEGGGNNESAKS